MAAWIDALSFGRQWDQERDTPRIRHAFRVLGANRTEWPAPLDLVQALPESQQARITWQADIPATKEEREAYLAKLRQLYRDIVRPID